MWKALYWAFDQDGLKPTEKLLLVTLAQLSTQRGYAFCSQAYLCQRLNVSENTLRRAICVLEECDLIRRQMQTQPTGGRESDNYYLHPDAGRDDMDELDRLADAWAEEKKQPQTRRNPHDRNFGGGGVPKLRGGVPNLRVPYNDEELSKDKRTIPNGIVTKASTKQTFKQAMEEGSLKADCIAKTKRLFTEKDWPQIDLDLLWEEFAQYWGEESPRKKHANWPTAFYNRAVSRRTWSAFQIEELSNGISTETEAQRSRSRVEGAREILRRRDQQDIPGIP